MPYRYLQELTTESVAAAQERYGSRAAIQRMIDGVGHGCPDIQDDEADFIAERDSFYLGTVNEHGWPYLQHRGGPARIPARPRTRCRAQRRGLGRPAREPAIPVGRQPRRVGKGLAAVDGLRPPPAPQNHRHRPRHRRIRRHGPSELFATADRGWAARQGRTAHHRQGAGLRLELPPTHGAPLTEAETLRRARTGARRTRPPARREPGPPRAGESTTRENTMNKLTVRAVERPHCRPRLRGPTRRAGPDLRRSADVPERAGHRHQVHRPERVAHWTSARSTSCSCRTNTTSTTSTSPGGSTRAGPDGCSPPRRGHRISGHWRPACGPSSTPRSATCASLRFRRCTVRRRSAWSTGR